MIKAYACYNTNDKDRKKSSSGAVFPLFARSCIEAGGVVYAAIYDDEWNVVHKRINNVLEIEKGQGSKYVASYLGDTFIDVKRDLQNNIPVVFTGTPCQVAGLLSFLQAMKVSKEKLYTIDFVCHGVPSSRVWRKYLSGHEGKRRIINLNMRDKVSGWSNGNYSWSFQYEDGKIDIIPRREVSYMRGMVESIYLRESCYLCRFKGIARNSDVTLGDYWHVGDQIPKMDDNYGTSIVIIQTKKGLEWFKSISSHLIYCEAEAEKAASANLSMVISELRHPNRESFFSRLESENFDQLVQSTSYLSILQRIVRKVRSCMNSDERYSKEDQRQVDAEGFPKFFKAKALCCGCTACFSVCAKKAISMVKDDEGFEFPTVDKTICIKCYRCLDTCPIKQKDLEE